MKIPGAAEGFGDGTGSVGGVRLNVDCGSDGAVDSDRGQTGIFIEEKLISLIRWIIRNTATRLRTTTAISAMIATFRFRLFDIRISPPFL